MTRLSLKFWKASWRKGPELSLEGQQELAKKKELDRQPRSRERIFQSMQVSPGKELGLWELQWQASWKGSVRRQAEARVENWTLRALGSHGFPVV